MKMSIVASFLLILSSCNIESEKENVWLDYSKAFQLIDHKKVQFRVTQARRQGGSVTDPDFPYPHNIHSLIDGKHTLSLLGSDTSHYQLVIEAKINQSFNLKEVDSVSIIYSAHQLPSNQIYLTDSLAHVFNFHFLSLYISEDNHHFDIINNDINKHLMKYVRTNKTFYLRLNMGYNTGLNFGRNLPPIAANTMQVNIELALQSYFTN